MFNLESFIQENIVKRNKSLFAFDVENANEDLLKSINQKNILIIGGAGSIGSSFIHAILKFHPASLVVVDINENGLTELTRDLRSTDGIYVPDEYITYPMDYATPIFKKMFQDRKGFDIVANFSAHKHVRSEKDIYSVEALLQNNVLKAKQLLDLLIEFPPEQYFCVSTDKAANPANIMGASKRIMEDIIFSYSDKFSVKTARFANVAFSNGSLPAGFLNRIQKCQPLSAPYDIERYFVSPEESGQICMLSCFLGNNREIFFPKLEKTQMMRFDQIAVKLLEAQGYEVIQCASEGEAIKKSLSLQNGGRQYPVYFSTSDTSGEKAYEEFYTDSEQVDMQRFQSLGVIINKRIPDEQKVVGLLMKLEEAFGRGTTKNEIVSILEDYIPDFSHIETGKSLESKM